MATSKPPLSPQYQLALQCRVSGTAGAVIKCGCVSCNNIRMEKGFVCIPCSSGGRCLDAARDGPPPVATPPLVECPVCTPDRDVRDRLTTYMTIVQKSLAWKPQVPTIVNALFLSSIANSCPKLALDTVQDNRAFLNALAERDRQGWLEVLPCEYVDEVARGGDIFAGTQLQSKQGLVRTLMGDDDYGKWEACAKKAAQNWRSMYNQKQHDQIITLQGAAASSKGIDAFAIGYAEQYSILCGASERFAFANPASMKLAPKQRVFHITYTNAERALIINLYQGIMWAPQCVNLKQVKKQLFVQPAATGRAFGCAFLGTDSAAAV